jgi:hypothetical protein
LKSCLIAFRNFDPWIWSHIPAVIRDPSLDRCHLSFGGKKVVPDYLSLLARKITNPWQSKTRLPGYTEYWRPHWSLSPVNIFVVGWSVSSAVVLILVSLD